MPFQMRDDRLLLPQRNPAHQMRTRYIAHFDLPRLVLIWNFCLLLCTARHSVGTVLDNLEPLTGSHDTVVFSSNFPPPSSGSGDSLVSISSDNTTPNGVNNDQGNERALDLPGNWNRGPEPFFLSESNDCRLDVNQAAHEHRRRIRRGERESCLPNYSVTSPSNGNPSKIPTTSTSSEGSQDSAGEAGAEGPGFDRESALPQSPPAADPSWCPYPDRPIPVCASYVWARNAISPYMLPSCAPSMCLPLLTPEATL